MKKLLPKIRLVLCLSLLSSSLSGAEYYVTPAGAGTQDGSTWANALPQAELASQINRLAAGDQLYLGSGTYAGLETLSIANSGTPDSPISLIGVDTGSGLPVLSDTWDEDNPSEGLVCFYFRNGASHWQLKDLRVTRYRNAVRLEPGPTHINIRVDNVDVEYARDPIWIESADDCTFTNIDVTKYTKKGFRLQEACNNIVVSNSSADASGGDTDWYNKTERIVMGFLCNARPNITNITFENCVAKHNQQNDQPGYPNGDGFCNEQDNDNVRYINCRAYDNQDGGFDCKAKNNVFEGCVAFNNYRNYRYWEFDATMNNCLSGYAAEAGLWAHGNVTVTNSTFVGNGKIVGYDGSGSATFDDVIFWESGTAPACDNCLTEDPEFVDPVGPAWEGTPADAYNSTRYPGRGYTYVSASTPPVITRLSASPTQGETPLPVTFAVTANDPDGSVSTYRWDFGDGTTSSQPAPTHVFTTPGNYTVRVVVEDDTRQSVTDQIVVTVSGNTPPTVSWQAPQDGNRFVTNGSVTLSATADDSDGTVTLVEFFDGSTKVGETQTPPYTIDVKNLATGPHRWEVRVTDSDGGVASEMITTTAAAVTPTGIQAASSTPDVDGTVEESWNDYPTYSLENVTVGSAPGSPAELSATWQARWDATNLYVLVVVTDDDLSSDSEGRFWQDDGVEVYLDINYDQQTTYGNDDYQFVFRYNDRVVRGNGAAVGATFAQGSWEEGYVIEAQFPWAALGTLVQSDMLLGIDVAVSDDDAGGDKERKLAWQATADTGFEDPSVFGVGRLAGTAARSPAYGGVPTALPGRLEAENYDTQGAGVSYYDTEAGNSGEGCRSDDVDVALPGQGTCLVGWIQTGEWLEYTVDVPTAGTYALEARVSSPYADRRFEIVADGGSVSSGPINVEQTGGWNTWRTVVVDGLALNEGTQTLRFNMLSSDFNLDYVDFTLNSTSRTIPPTSPEVKLTKDGSDHVVVYPNPWGSRDLTIAGTASIPSRVRVYGIHGQLVYQAAVSSDQVTLSRSLIPAGGIYTIVVSNDAYTKAVRVVVE